MTWTFEQQQQMQQQQLYQQQQFQMAQQQRQGQLAVMQAAQQPQAGVHDGVPGQTMVNIPPVPPGMADSQAASFQQRPQPALMQLDAQGNVVRGQ
jgi:hypothetical protein